MKWFVNITINNCLLCNFYTVRSIFILLISSFSLKIFYSKDIFQNNYFIILRWCWFICHVAWSFIFHEKCDQTTVTIKPRCWHQLVSDMTWYEDEFDFNMIKQRCHLNTDVDINWFRTWNDKKMNLIWSRSNKGAN